MYVKIYLKAIDRQPVFSVFYIRRVVFRVGWSSVRAVARTLLRPIRT